MFTKNLNSEKYPERKHLRIKNYDYSTQGAYFITICTKDRVCLLSEVRQSKDEKQSPTVMLTAIGKEVEKSIEYIHNNNPDVSIDNYVIMPNHVHMLIVLKNRQSDVKKVIYQLKSYTTNRYKGVLWQRSYYDHVVRNEADYSEKYKYIDNNPSKWKSDRYFPV